MAENSKRCASCTEGSHKCVVVSWSVLERQQRDLEAQLSRAEEEEDRTLRQMIAYQQRLLEHRARVSRIKQTLALSKARSKAKTLEELHQQDEVVEERIRTEGLRASEQEDINAVNLAEQDMNAFLFDTPPNTVPAPSPNAVG